MFIRNNNKKDKIVNLDNVSNICIEGSDKGKIIFNMNYSVRIFGGEEKTIEVITEAYIEYSGDGDPYVETNYEDITITTQESKSTPDYVYWYFNSKEELEELKNIFLPNIKNWILPQEQGHRYVNPKCVSSIGTDEYNNRVIFNLNYQITHPKDNSKLTSDFVFYNFSNKDEYNNFINSLAQL